jgi:UDP-N-acetylglucosamine--N-acetylmuramyl-(pentapeptide) pyrophosphoryl-undecaprenol N-acetylglucosamine transferase
LSQSKPYKILLSGGGTGGHIYPAVAVAKAFVKEMPDTEILFVGAEGKMEMEKVPKEGFDIVGLPVAGLHRRFTLKNLLFPFKLLKSMRMAKKVLKDFQPDLAIGFGGYASGPVLKQAQKRNVSTMIQEQNSFAGLTNKWLAEKAAKICVAYDGMDAYFPKSNIVFTGNPVRSDLLDLIGKKEKALAHFGLNNDKPVVLVIGGSLGARTLNDAFLNSAADLSDKGIQVLWQCGQYYYDALKPKVTQAGVQLHKFIYEMDLAYAAADLVVSRAGALSISELCVAEKACVLVPSPNVAEDHQTKNAMALVSKGAAVMVKDEDALLELAATVVSLISSDEQLKELERNVRQLGRPNAANDIVNYMKEVLA